MLSTESRKAFNDDGYAIYERNNQISFSSARKPVGVFIFILAILIISLPILLIYFHIAYSLLVAILALLPAYHIIKGTEVPDTVTIDASTKIVELISVSGVRSKSFNFKSVLEIGIRSFEEMKNANAFDDNTSSTIYFICFNLPGRSLDALRFSQASLESIKTIKKELQNLIVQNN